MNFCTSACLYFGNGIKNISHEEVRSLNYAPDIHRPNVSEPQNTELCAIIFFLLFKYQFLPLFFDLPSLVLIFRQQIPFKYFTPA